MNMNILDTRKSEIYHNVGISTLLWAFPPPKNGLFQVIISLKFIEN